MFLNGELGREAEQVNAGVRVIIEQDFRFARTRKITDMNFQG